MVCVIVSAAFEFIPIGCIGLLFAKLYRSCEQGPSLRTERRWKRATLAVTFLCGYAAGRLLSSNCLLAQLGTTALAAVGICILALVLLVNLVRHRPIKTHDISCAVFAGIALFALPMGPMINSLYGLPSTSLDGWDVRYFRQGSQGDVRLVVRGSQRNFQFDGISVTGSAESVKAELALAYLPRLMRPKCTNVVVIGLGSAATAGASALFPDTRVVCLEPEPAFLPALEIFGDVNYQTNRSKYFSLLSQEPKSLYAGKRGGVDLVLVSYADARLPQSWQTSRKSFYEAAQYALSPQGILAHRIAIGSYSTADLAVLIRATLSDFEHCALAQISDTEWLLMASKSPLVASSVDVQLSQALVDSKVQLRRELVRCFGSSEVAPLLASHIILDQDGLRRLLATGKVEHGLDLGSDRTGLAEDSDHSVRGTTLLVERSVTQAADLGFFRVNFALCGCKEKDAWVAQDLQHLFVRNRQCEMALRVVNWGLELNPDQSDLIADRLILTMEERPQVLDSTIERIAKHSLESAIRVGASLRERGRVELSVRIFEQITRTCPTSIMAWRNLASSYGYANKLDKEREALCVLLGLDATDEPARTALHELGSSAD
jgi:hypothetical protein